MNKVHVKKKVLAVGTGTKTVSAKAGKTAVAETGRKLSGNKCYWGKY